MATIRNPIEWSYDQLRLFASHTSSMAHTLAEGDTEASVTVPKINKIEFSDLRDVLSKGFADFQDSRTDILALSVIYPIAGLLLWWIAANHQMLPLVFPLLSGFALIGPVAAVGLYEMSRQRENGASVNWMSAFDVVRSPSFGSILILGLGLLVIFVIWLGVAQYIYTHFLGVEPPKSATEMINRVVATSAGREMAIVGIAVGFIFAAFVLAISAVSFPLLLDRNVGPAMAVVTSVRAVVKNPTTMAVWGLVVVGALTAASVPLLLGLIVVVPILGHATWHLYRKVIAR